MIKNLIILIFISTIVISCSSTEKYTKENKTSETEGFEELDWVGSYTGEEECSTCKHISKTVTLYSNETFEATLEYIGSSKPLIERHTGDFKWGMNGKLHLEPESGSMVIEDYLVAHGLLIPVSDEGHPMTGGYTMLNKISAKSIFDKKWTLIELYGASVNSSDDENLQTAFINFDKNGAAYGNSSCNSFSGQFNTTNGQVLEFDAVSSTRKACQNMNTETKFLNMLENTKSYELENEELQLLDSDGNILGKFEYSSY